MNLLPKFLNRGQISLLVLRDIFSQFWHNYLLIGILSGISFAFQLIGFTTILSSFTGRMILPLHLEEAFKHFDKFSTISVGFIILVLSSILTFWARLLGVKMMVTYEEICSEKVIQKVQQRRQLLQDKSDAQIIGHLSKDCRYGGRIIQEICNIIMPLGFFFFAFPMMLYLNFEATLLIIGIVLLTLIPFGYIVSKARSISSDFEKAAALDNKTKRELLKNLRNDDAFKQVPSLPHPDFKRAYKQRLIMPHVGIMIGWIQVSLCLAAIALFVISTEKDGNHLSTIVIYGFISVFLLRQMMSATKVFTSFHIFLAYFQRAFEVIAGIHSTEHFTTQNQEDAVTFMDDEL